MSWSGRLIVRHDADLVAEALDGNPVDSAAVASWVITVLQSLQPYLPEPSRQ